MSPILAVLMLRTSSALDAGPLARRGDYITFMRMPTYDLADWKGIVEGVQDDGGDTPLLWVGGAFRSRQFPITWRCNEERENVRHDFVRERIDHAREGCQGAARLHPLRL